MIRHPANEFSHPARKLSGAQRHSFRKTFGMFRIRMICSIMAFYLAWPGQRRAVDAADEVVTIYPTYGYQMDGTWVIPMRLWVHERRTVAELGARNLAAEIGKISPGELVNFRSRIADFLADSESREEVLFAFDHDPDNQNFQVIDSENHFQKSDLNGIIEGRITLPLKRAEGLLESQKSRNGWLSISVTSKGHTGKGLVRLIEPEGTSVISDIDDTIKVTEIPAGPEVVVRNTLLRDYKAAPEMAAKYGEWSNASFHYVSGGPWQMYGPLSEYLIDSKQGFPEGSFHMKNVPTNLFSKSSWKDLKKLVISSEHTYDHKIAQITLLVQRFPQRHFILVGDSGEKDPEVYRAVREKFPHHVREIWIRDIVNDRQENPDRLATMNVIPATTAKPGVSEFESEPQAPK